jgi:hypothetical protein
MNKKNEIPESEKRSSPGTYMICSEDDCDIVPEVQGIQGIHQTTQLDI